MSFRLIASLSLLVLSAISANSQAQAPVYTQCGGLGWAGPEVCTPPNVCVPLNVYFSQCTPPDEVPVSCVTTIYLNPTETSIIIPAHPTTVSSPSAMNPTPVSPTPSPTTWVDPSSVFPTPAASSSCSIRTTVYIYTTAPPVTTACVAESATTTCTTVTL